MSQQEIKSENDYRHINERLKEVLPQLPRALQVASTYMLEHPGDIATLSMRKVASNAGVSLPNFARLAKMIGYHTYSELREVYRRRVQQRDINKYHLRAKNLQKSGCYWDEKELWEQFCEATVSNITTLFKSIDPDYFADVAKVLTESRTVFLAGMQASASFSAYAHYLGGMASSKFQLIRGDGGVFADPIAEISESDAMIVISHQPSSRAAVELAQIAKERGASVIAITDSPASPTAIEADYVLLAPNHGPMFFESYVSSTILIEALIGFFSVAQPSGMIERIERIEADRARMNEYWNDRKS